MSGWVYILASQPRGTLYVGVTSDLLRRISQHRQKLADGFTKQHNVTQLVYLEQYDDVGAAIAREKVLKKWKRDWKISLIEQNNPYWIDLYPRLSL